MNSVLLLLLRHCSSISNFLIFHILVSAHQPLSLSLSLTTNQEETGLSLSHKSQQIKKAVEKTRSQEKKKAVTALSSLKDDDKRQIRRWVCANQQLYFLFSFNFFPNPFIDNGFALIFTLTDVVIDDGVSPSSLIYVVDGRPWVLKGGGCWAIEFIADHGFDVIVVGLLLVEKFINFGSWWVVIVDVKWFFLFLSWMLP